MFGPMIGKLGCLVLIILLTLTTTCVAIAGDTRTKDISFADRVAKYLQKLTSYRVVRNENLNGTGQSTPVENAVWAKQVTLKAKETTRNIYHQRTYQRLFFSFYQFADSTQCAAARDSILRCFSGSGTTVVWGVAQQSAKSIPCIYIFNPTEIIICHIHCEQESGTWSTHKRNLRTHFESAGGRTMEVGCGGPFAFYTR